MTFWCCHWRPHSSDTLLTEAFETKAQAVAHEAAVRKAGARQAVVFPVEFGDEGDG